MGKRNSLLNTTTNASSIITKRLTTLYERIVLIGHPIRRILFCANHVDQEDEQELTLLTPHERKSRNALASKRFSHSTSDSERTPCFARRISLMPPRAASATNRLVDTKPMAIKRPWNRAKIFQPFDALPGLRELMRQKERAHETQFDEHGNELSKGQDICLPSSSPTGIMKKEAFE